MDNGLFDKEKTYQFEIEGEGYPYHQPSIYTGIVLGQDATFLRIRDRDGIERGFRKNRIKGYWEHIPGKKSRREAEIEEEKKREDTMNRSGHIDIDIITTPNSLRGERGVVLSIVKEMARNMEKVPIHDVIAKALNMGIDEEKARGAIIQLKKSGDVYEPDHGFLKSV